LRDDTDASSADFGGWELVFEYCKLHFNDALATNDYVVVQLDTDCGDHANFGVPLTEEGKDRRHVDIIDDAKRVIVACIGEEVFEQFRDRVVFAISVHSIESWLLLCLFARDEPKSSFNRLKAALKRADDTPLVKEVRRYKKLTRNIKRKHIRAAGKQETSFATFLDDLHQVCDRANNLSTNDC
jgi:hypothetical protein